MTEQERRCKHGHDHATPEGAKSCQHAENAWSTDDPTITCPDCGFVVRQVGSATPHLALWQHWIWTCPNHKEVGIQTPQHMANALEKYAQWCGGVHDEGCPEDDTCSCSTKWINDGVNAACRFLRELK